MIKSIFFDIDGTLVSRGLVLPGAIDAITYARKQGLSLRFLTNITGRTPSVIATELRQQGLDIEDIEIQTANTACVEYLKSRHGITCHLIVPSNIKSMFDGIVIDDNTPDVVVLSDIGEKFNFGILNRAFLMLRAGAELVVPQKGLFWFDHDGPKLDCGSFIVGLEAASGKKAIVTGKPAEVFFRSILSQVGCCGDEVLVVGDDITTDILGASTIGAYSALVGTGKYIPGIELDHKKKPDYFLPTLEDFPNLLNSFR